ncbi:hypothetical protein [Streptomyces thermolilacinus]
MTEEERFTVPVSPGEDLGTPGGAKPRDAGLNVDDDSDQIFEIVP